MNLVTIEQVEQYTCDSYGTSIEEVKSMSKKKDPSSARKMIIYLLFKFTKMDIKAIASHYGMHEIVVGKALGVIRLRVKIKGKDKDVSDGFENKFINPKTLANG